MILAKKFETSRFRVAPLMTAMVMLGAFIVSTTARGATIATTGDTSAANLSAALVVPASGLNVSAATLSSHTSGAAMSSGTYALIGPGGGTYGIASPGVVLSTGDVNDYSTGPNNFANNTTAYSAPATPAQSALLAPIAGPYSFFDVTQLNLTIDMDPGFDKIYFAVTFGSDEYAEYVGSQFQDAFGIYVNGTNVAFANSLPFNIDNPGFIGAPGTELDGVIQNIANNTFQIIFGANVPAGSAGNTLTFIIADTSDDIYDSTVYISQLSATQIPEPGTGVLLAIGGVFGCGLLVRRRTRK